MSDRLNRRLSPAREPLQPDLLDNSRLSGRPFRPSSDMRRHEPVVHPEASGAATRATTMGQLRPNITFDDPARSVLLDSRASGDRLARSAVRSPRDDKNDRRSGARRSTLGREAVVAPSGFPRVQLARQRSTSPNCDSAFPCCPTAGACRSYREYDPPTIYRPAELRPGSRRPTRRRRERRVRRTNERRRRRLVQPGRACAVREERALNASANAYEWTRLTLSGLGASTDRASFSSLSTYVGAVVGRPPLPWAKWRLGVSVTRPVSWSPGVLNPAFKPPSSDGAELVGYSSNVDFSTMLWGLSVGYAPRGVGKSPFRIGGGLAAARTSLSQDLTLSDRVTTSSAASTQLRSFSAEGSTISLVASGGLQWDMSTRDVRPARRVARNRDHAGREPGARRVRFLRSFLGGRHVPRRARGLQLQASVRE